MIPGSAGRDSNMELKLTAVYEEVPKAEGGGFVAYVEELPGAITQGETLDETRENLRDAVALLLEANRALAKETQAGRKVIHEQIAVSVA
jgi:predicted RNase H-like HicB family nuclease